MRMPPLVGAALLAVLPFATPGAHAGEPAAPASPPAPASPGWQERLARDSATPEAWKARAADIRLQILVSAGLWPPFDRPPLKPVVFGKIDRDGYSVEKVHFETWPGFHLTGNLYRPLNKKGPFPGVVSPHGHWKHGRFNDDKDGSVPGRALTLARLGCVVFSYDMVGYGDCTQVPHLAKPPFGDEPWGISLLGLQLWDSLRAVDFLCALPDVDPKRIGATGASGGGTQTFLLTAVDDRIACAAPVCMVAGEFQGGCLCENAPLLRIGLNNVEIAAAAAPRPLLLVSATGDWTKDNPTLEAPAIRKVYERLGASERFACVQQKAGHNYNKASREWVYDWFMTWLIQSPPPPGSKPMQVFGLPEAPFEVETREALAVFGPDHPRPEGAVDRDGLTKVMQDAIRAQLEALRPKDAASLVRFRELMTPALQSTVTLPRFPISTGIVNLDPPASDYTFGKGTLTLPRAKLEFNLRLGKSFSELATILFVPTDPTQLNIQEVIPKHQKLLILASQVSPQSNANPSGGTPEQIKNFPTTYFQPHFALNVMATWDGLFFPWTPDKSVKTLHLVGIDEAGPAVLLARSLIPADKVKVAKTIVDIQGIVDDDPASWTGDRAQPGILRVGGLRTAGILAAALGGDLVIHNTQGKFDATWIREAFKAAGREAALTVSEGKWTTEQILQALK